MPCEGDEALNHEADAQVAAIRADKLRTRLPMPSGSVGRNGWAIGGSSRDLKFVWSALSRRRRYVAWVSGAILLCTVLALVACPAEFESTARVAVDPPGSEAFSLRPALAGAGESDYVATQAEILRSIQLSVEVLRALSLDRSPVVQKRMPLEAALEFAGVPSVVRALGWTPRPVGASDNAHLRPHEMRALRYLRRHLQITVLRNTRVIEVGFRSADAELAAKAANTVADLFLISNAASQNEAVGRSIVWLDQQLGAIKKRAETSQARLESYRRKNGIVEVDQTQSASSQRKVELVRHHAQAQAEIIQLDALLSRVGAFGIKSLPQYQNNSIIQQLELKQSDVAGQLSQALVTFGENHPEIAKLRNELAELNQTLEEQEAGIVKELRGSHQAARARERALAQAVARVEASRAGLSGYETLSRQAQADEELYNSLNARVEEVAMSAGSKSCNVRVIDRAIVADKPIWPNFIVMLPIALLASLFGGVAAGLAREALDGTLRSHEDLMQVAGDQRFILLPDAGKQGRQRGNQSADKQRSSSGQFGRVGVARFMLDEPGCAAAESMRALMGSILLSRSRSRAKVVLVASPFPGDGKTTVAYNLALSLAEKGSTCFIDADLRKQQSKNANGLFSYYNNAATADEIEMPSGDSPNLMYVDAGAGSENPISVLVSERFEHLASSLRSRYEFVVIDSPPLLPYADARFLAALADGVVLVGYEGVTSRKAMESSVAILTDLSAPILGVVLNGVRPDKRHYGAYC